MPFPLLLTTVGIVDEMNAILFIQRANEPFHGLFSLPGGKLKEDEKLAEGAKREINEELGLSLNNLQLLNISEFHKPGHAIVSIYICRIASPVLIQPNPLEVAATKWVSEAELPSLGELPPNHALVAKYIFKALNKLDHDQAQ